MTNNPIADNIAKVRARIRMAARACERDPDSIQLMAVSKARTAGDIRSAAAAGISHIGENYLQEARGKIALLNDPALCWHFIGPVQSNKTRAVAENFDWVHSVDRLKIARRLNEHRPQHRPPLQICLQVNIGAEHGKSGVPIQEIEALAGAICDLPGLCMRGLMAIPRAGGEFRLQRDNFARLREALQGLRRSHQQLDTLSMGMSADLEAAIAEGATMVRIGTDIFGPR